MLATFLLPFQEQECDRDGLVSMHLLRGERRWVDLGVECQGERLAMTGCRRLGGGLDSWCGDEPYCVLRGTGEGCVVCGVEWSG